MALHVIVGAGPTGQATARRLAERGEQVRLVSRSGGADLPGVEAFAADVTDTEALSAISAGAATIVNAAMPPYDQWAEHFQPINTALLDVAARSGSRYILFGNMYGYGPVDGPYTEEQPLAPTTIKGRVRVAMWEEALEAQIAGRVEVAELRASDYIGRGAFSIFSLTVAAQLLEGVPAIAPANLDIARSWTRTDDVGALAVAVTARDDVWGRAWHVPSNPPESFRDLAARFAALTGIESYTLEAMTPQALAELARNDSVGAEFPEMQYLFQRAAVLESTVTQRELGVTPGSMDEALLEMADGLRAAQALT